MTKNGTPVAPYPRASRKSACTASAYASLVQRPSGLVLGYADLGAEPYQRVGVVDGFALAQVGTQHLVTQPVRRGQVAEAVGVDRVDRDGPLQVVRQPLGGGEFCDLPGHCPHLRERGPGPLRQRLEDGPAVALGVRGVELEAVPVELHLVGVLKPVERRLQAPLADVAPRTDDVRPDVDAQRAHRTHTPSTQTAAVSEPRFVRGGAAASMPERSSTAVSGPSGAVSTGGPAVPFWRGGKA